MKIDEEINIIVAVEWWEVFSLDLIKPNVWKANKIVRRISRKSEQLDWQDGGIGYRIKEICLHSSVIWRTKRFCVFVRTGYRTQGL